MNHCLTIGVANELRSTLEEVKTKYKEESESYRCCVRDLQAELKSIKTQ